MYGAFDSASSYLSGLGDALSACATEVGSVHTISQNLGRSDQSKIAKSALKFSNFAILQDLYCCFHIWSARTPRDSVESIVNTFAVHFGSS